MGVVPSYPQVPPTHPLLDRVMVLEASSACCRVFCFVLFLESKSQSPGTASLRDVEAAGRGTGSSGIGWGMGGLWASHLPVPAAGADLEGGDFQARLTQRFRHAGKSMMMTAAGSSGGRRHGPRAAEAPPARRRSPPRLGHQGARGARAAPCSAPREGQHD